VIPLDGVSGRAYTYGVDTDGKKIPDDRGRTLGSAGQPLGKRDGRTPKRRRRREPRRGAANVLNVRGSPEWADWVRDLAGAEGVSALVTRLLDAYAHQVGAPPAPPRALPAPVRPPPDRDGSGQPPDTP
jgi:hypothetical protein